MIIKYSRKLQRKNLLPGIILLILGVISVGIEPLNPVRYLPVSCGFLFLGHYFFLKKTPYLQIEGDVLTTRNSFRKREIKLSEVIGIRKFAGDITLFTSKTKLKIHEDAIDEASKQDLDQLLASLDVEAEEYPCKKISFNNS